MALWGFNAAARADEQPLVLVRKSMRLALLGLGYLLMIVGLPLALLPLFMHVIGIGLFATGLIVVLRNSTTARRTFIRAQHRHPNILFPIRRLIRPKPEILPVLWHQMLRFERWVLPRRMRFYRRVRHGLSRRRRR